MAVAGRHGVAGGGGPQKERGGGAGQAWQWRRARRKPAVARPVVAQPVVASPPWGSSFRRTQPSKHRPFRACLCGSESNFRGNLFSFKCRMSPKATPAVSPVPKASVDSQVGGSSMPAAAGPVAALRVEHAQADEPGCSRWGRRSARCRCGSTRSGLVWTSAMSAALPPRGSSSDCGWRRLKPCASFGIDHGAPIRPPNLQLGGQCTWRRTSVKTSPCTTSIRVV